MKTRIMRKAESEGILIGIGGDYPGHGKIIGGQGAPSPVGDLGLTQMTDALRLERLAVECVGQDYLISGYLCGDKHTL